eukprot:357269-Chlamydomonas_euryale.AAC.1
MDLETVRRAAAAPELRDLRRKHRCDVGAAATAAAAGAAACATAAGCRALRGAGKLVPCGRVLSVGAGVADGTQ